MLNLKIEILKNHLNRKYPQLTANFTESVKMAKSFKIIKTIQFMGNFEACAPSREVLQLLAHF